MQLFAIITKQGAGVTEKERLYVKEFLTQQISQDSVLEYLKLYDDFSNGGLGKVVKKRTSVLDSVKTMGICQKINKTLTQKQKLVVLIRLLELVRSEGKYSHLRKQIVDTVSDVFKISVDEHKIIENFVLKKRLRSINDSAFIIIDNKSNGQDIKNKYGHIQSNHLNGLIGILKVNSVNMYFVKYLGDDDIYLNGFAMRNNQVYIFTYGSIIKLQKGNPIFYSDVVSYYLKDLKISPISFNAENINYNFPNGQPGLVNINLSEGTGKLVSIMGASGAGKTTLLNIFTGIEKPSNGKITINGLNIHTQKDQLEGVIGYVAQEDLLFEDLTVFQNLYYNARLCFDNLSDKEINRQVINTLDNLGLLEIKHLKVGTILDKKISGGQRKRLNIALELIREPSVMFLDEPTSGLSSRDSENVMDLLKELALKGKLLFVVIHQPSSEIYKMFDKIIILDLGGYPIYYGNPIEAVMYFKKHTGQVDSERGQCIDCGNVNPEQIFNAVEAKIVDEYGNHTNERKMTSLDWYNLFSNKIKIEKVDPVKTIPQRSLAIPSMIKQFWIFTIRDFLTKISNKQYLLINLLEAPVLAFLLAGIIRYVDNPGTDEYFFGNNDNLPAYLFMCVIVAIFMGLTVSAEEIIRDRKILKRERFLNLSWASYLISKIKILFSLSAIQMFLFVITGNLILGIKGMVFEYWLVLFTCACFANILGLNISATFNSAVTIYILIPILLIPQMILSGALFNFDQLHQIVGRKDKVPFIADFMTARWAFEALAVNQFINNKYEKPYYSFEKQESTGNYKQVYYIPTLEDKVYECNEQQFAGTVIAGFNEDNEKKLFDDKNKISDYFIRKVSKNLLLLHNEISQEMSVVKSVKFQYLKELNLEKYNTVIGDSVLSYFVRLNDYYKKMLKDAGIGKEKLINKQRGSGHSSIEVRENKEKEYMLKKLNYYNEEIKDMVKNVTVNKKIIEYNGKLIQKSDPIFLDPVNISWLFDYRAHFYAPRKHFAGQLFNTFYFNIIIIWLMVVVLYITLYFESFKWLMDLPGKFKIKKLKNIL